jgi:hypothetical protein
VSFDRGRIERQHAIGPWAAFVQAGSISSLRAPRRRHGLAGVATARSAVAMAKFWQKVVVSE